MKFGRNKRVAGTAVGLILAGMVLSGPAFGQDLGRTLNEAYDLQRRGQTKAANQKARAVLAADPSSEDAYQLVRTTDASVFLEMLKAGGQLELAAKFLLQRSQPAAVAASADEGAIRTLVARATAPGSDLMGREDAARELAAKHGEYAVPSLVGLLGSNDTQARTNAILALSRIGTDAVMPLAASLGSGNTIQQKNTASLLGRIGDERAVPALLAAAKGPAASEAAEAAAKLGATGGDAAAAYLALAKSFFHGDPQTLRNYDGSYAVWNNEGGKLAKRDVPRFMYHFELAEQAAYDALGVNAGLSAARSMIALANAAELAAWDVLSDDGKAALKDATASLGGARGLMSATGTADLLGAVSMGSALGNGSAVAILAAAVADTWNGGAVDAGNALVKGLDSGDKTVRYACALALLSIDPAKSFPKAAQVAVEAGNAASEVALRSVLVIDSDSKNAMNVQRKLNDSGYHALAATSGAAGLRMAKAAGGFDAVVVRSVLSDMTTFQVLAELNRDFRTANAKTLVMASGSDLGSAQSDFDKYGIAGAAPTGNDLVGVLGAVNKALEGDEGTWAAQKAAAQSIAASDALARSRGGGINLSGAQNGLLAALKDGAPDEVRLAALGALANLADANAQDALAAVVGKTDNSAAVRAHACKALGRSLRGQSPKSSTLNALTTAMGDDDVSVRTAAGGALGAANLTDAQRADVLRKQRVN